MEKNKNCGRIMIAGTGSGCGKTTVTSGLLQCLVNRGIRPASFKCGPDYIDPMFHSRIIGASSGNLDAYFSDRETLRWQVESGSKGCGMTVIEGVMGYYDGIGFTSEASSFSVARALDCPVILVVNAAGMGASVCAVLQGFLDYPQITSSGIKGVIFNNMSEKIYHHAAQAAEAMGIKPLGYLPRNKKIALESRHLGLVTAEEVENLKEKMNILAENMEKTVRIDDIIDMSENAAALDAKMPEGLAEIIINKSAANEIFESAVTEAGAGEYEKTESGADETEVFKLAASEAETAESAKNKLKKEDTQTENQPENESVTDNKSLKNRSGKNVRIAVAADEAFCFTYRENLQILEMLGCEIVKFSPLRDEQIPEGTDGIILSGGYPELHAAGLAENHEMLGSIRGACENGVPVIAECGGFMYLHEKLEGADGNHYSMAGVIKGGCFKTDRLQRFGYIKLRSMKDGMLCGSGDELKAHEFHYWDSENCGNDFTAVKADGSRSWECAVSTENMYAGFPHLFFLEMPEAAVRFVRRCEEYRNCRKQRD